MYYYYFPSWFAICGYAKVVWPFFKFHSMLSGQFLSRQFPNYGAWGICVVAWFDLSFYQVSFFSRSLCYLSTSISPLCVISCV